MILSGHVACVDGDNASTRIAEAIHHGDSEAPDQQAFGNRLRFGGDLYDPEVIHSLTPFSADRSMGLRIESTDRKTTRQYAAAVGTIFLIKGRS
jgi:hypothetical protein